MIELSNSLQLFEQQFLKLHYKLSEVFFFLLFPFEELLELDLWWLIKGVHYWFNPDLFNQTKCQLLSTLIILYKLITMRLHWSNYHLICLKWFLLTISSRFPQQIYPSVISFDLIWEVFSWWHYISLFFFDLLELEGIPKNAMEGSKMLLSFLKAFD